ncbi:MAG: recombinase family protein [Phycisphaerae bacterium]|nr:recombinase family protein [Tepidisphaeraceae bacterium]
MNLSKLRGKRCVFLIRCSSAKQAEDSLADQEAGMHDFCAQHGLVFVWKFASDVSGSVPGRRTDIKEVIARKKTVNDFEIVLVQDSTRLTRTGTGGGGHILSEFAAAGLKVVFVGEVMPEDEDDFELVTAVNLYTGKKSVKSLAYSSARGGDSAIRAKEIPYCAKPAYGIDRLYVGKDGTPRHIIHFLPDGTSQKLDPHTRAVLGEFKGTYRNEKGDKVCETYRKQKDEHAILVPGDPCQIETVRKIFRWKLVEGLGYSNPAYDWGELLRRDDGQISPALTYLISRKERSTEP